MLIHEIRPATIIELGAGSGASASWLADIAGPIQPRILSIDINAPIVVDPRVEFHLLDINEIDTLLTEEFTAPLEHPWLVIEDAHVNIRGVLETVHRCQRARDYLIIEDSLQKRTELLDFLKTNCGCYALDTHYADLFGENSTCAMDSFLVRRK
jgi:cephalosporin hydroxylase